jgi:hypothetical protein
LAIDPAQASMAASRAKNLLRIMSSSNQIKVLEQAEARIPLLSRRMEYEDEKKGVPEPH